MIHAVHTMRYDMTPHMHEKYNKTKKISRSNIRIFHTFSLLQYSIIKYMKLCEKKKTRLLYYCNIQYITFASFVLFHFNAVVQYAILKS